MQQNNIFNYIREHISILDVAQKFPEFYKTLQKTGNDYGTSCPTGHKSASGKSFKLVFDPSTQKNFYICHSCGITGNSFGLVCLLTGWDTRHTIDWFIKQWNLDDSYRHYNEHVKTAEELEEEKKENIRTLLFEKLLEVGKTMLFEPEGKASLDYLVNKRKYIPELIKQTDWMYLPPQVEAKAILYDAFPGFKSYIDDLKLVSIFGDHFRLALPYRSNYGIITGLVLRADTPEGVSGTTFQGVEFVKQRWTSTPGTQKNVLFGINKIKHTDTILIVEGYPDVTYLPALGYKNIVGFGQAKFGNKQLQNLINKNIQNVYLGLDNDKVGPANTAAVIKLLMEHKIRVYVLDPKSMTPFKDPDEFAVANGIEAFERIVSSSSSGELWIINYLYNTFPDTPKGKADAFEQALIYGALINTAVNELAFVDLLSSKSGVTKRQITSYINKARKSIIQTADEKPDKRNVTKEEYQNALSKSADDLRKKILSEYLSKGPIIPFQERTNKDYYIYDKGVDDIILINNKDKLDNACKDEGVVTPEVLPGLKIIFNPQSFEKLNIEDRTLNLFTPTKYMYWEKNDEKINLDTDCPYIMRIFNNIIPDPEKHNYIWRWLNWLAYIFQKRTKSNVAWVFMGQQGIGKNMMFEEIIKPFFSDKLAASMDNHEAHSDYNSKLRNKLFMVFNEISHNKAERNALAARLKVYITEPQITTRQIYGQHVVTDNHMNSIFFSNDTDMPVLLESSDRRYIVFNSTTPLAMYSDWNYYTWSKHVAEELPKFYRYLINFDVDYIRATTVFSTPAKLDVIAAGATRFEQFANALVNQDIGWFNEQLESAYALKNDMFGTKIKVVPDELAQKRILTTKARATFQTIFPDTKITANAFTRFLKPFGIKKERMRTGNQLDYYYIWKDRASLYSILPPKID